MSKQDKIEFQEYLANCTNAQVPQVWFKEKGAKREDYAELAYAEMEKRRLV